MFTKFICAAFIFTCTIGAALQPACPTNQFFEWLQGKWQMSTGGVIITEIWKPDKDQNLSGESYAVKGTDTLSYEKIRIEKIQDTLYYIPAVRNQNKGAEVLFKITALSDSGFTAVNPAHDFPQVITYKKITEDSLSAEISGSVKGKTRKQTFPMKRVK